MEILRSLISGIGSGLSSIASSAWSGMGSILGSKVTARFRSSPAQTTETPVTAASPSNEAQAQLLDQRVLSYYFSNVLFGGARIPKEGTWDISDAAIKAKINKNLGSLVNSLPTKKSSATTDAERGGFVTQVDESTTTSKESDSFKKISEQLFSDPHKAAALEEDLMNICDQDLPGTVTRIFMRGANPPDNAYFVSGGYTGTITLKKIDESRIKITLEGSSQETTQGATLLNKKHDTLTSNTQKATGKLNITATATINLHTGKITALTCDSASGSWNILDPHYFW